MFLRYILCAAAAYLLGSISTGVLLSHRPGAGLDDAYKVDF